MPPKYKRKTDSVSIVDNGKMQPQAVELEEGVLGAIMLEREALIIVVEILKADSFYVNAHKIIFAAAHSLYVRSFPVDIMTVTQELKKIGELDLVGGPYYITQLTNRVASAANAEYHARIISQKYIQRELIRISTLTIQEAYEEGADIFDLMESHEKRMTDLSGNFRTGKAALTPAKLWNELEERNKVLQSSQGLSGVPAGYPAIDKVTGGWQGGHLIIIAARPAMGKTALAINLARNAAVDFKKPVAIFSLEMSALELMGRMATSEAEVSNNKIMRKGMEDEEFIQLTDKCVKLINAPIFIDDTPALTMSELRSKARKMKRDHDIQMIVVDYLQLMSGETWQKGFREQEIASISRGLKTLSKELQIPIIALSQLSRAVETRGTDTRPKLSDLRESGAIEQDADEVMFIHRPEYYGITEDEHGMSTAGDTELIIAKHRNGDTGPVHLTWIGRLTKFIDKIAPEVVMHERDIQQPVMKSNPDAYITGKNKTEEFPF